jgi:hypothetical protein
MQFRIDPQAEKLPEDQERKTYSQVKPILKGAQPVYESIQDNDMERWLLTLGGQFLRQTGIDGGRYFVVPPAEAYDFIRGFASDEVLEAVSETLMHHGIEFTPALRPGM